MMEISALLNTGDITEEKAGMRIRSVYGAIKLARTLRFRKKLNRVVRQPSGFEQLPLKNAVFGSLDQKTARLVRQPTGLSNKSNEKWERFPATTVCYAAAVGTTMPRTPVQPIGTTTVPTTGGTTTGFVWCAPKLCGM